MLGAQQGIEIADKRGVYTQEDGVYLSVEQGALHPCVRLFGHREQFAPAAVDRVLTHVGLVLLDRVDILRAGGQERAQQLLLQFVRLHEALVHLVYRPPCRVHGFVFADEDNDSRDAGEQQDRDDGEQRPR